MAKIRYYYDTETCKYEPIKVSKNAMFWNIVGFLSVSLLIASSIIYAYRMNFTPVKESILRAENNQMKLEWSLLNDELSDAYSEIGGLQYKDDKIYRVILDTDAIPATIREGGVGGHNKYETLIKQNLEKPNLIVGTYERVDDLKKRIYIQSKSYDQISKILGEKEKMWSSRPAIQPINNKELTRLYTTFGRRFHPITKKWSEHEGLDFTAPTGTPVYATGDGLITASYRSASYGNVLFVNHGYGYQTRYAHLTEYIVGRGESVKRGQVIGYVGSTGRSEGPHLHYEVLFNYKPINPINFFQRDLDNDEYEKLIEISQQTTIPLD
jgi:hypothetical protein